MRTKKLKKPATSPAAPCYAPLVVLPANTAAETIAEVRAAGYVPVCCDDPTKVVTVYPDARIGGDMLMAALHGIVNGNHMDDVRSKMVLELHKRLLKREGA